MDKLKRGNFLTARMKHVILSICIPLQNKLLVSLVRFLKLSKLVSNLIVFL
jgi:hypothetical protein